jgi:hypothetical protein
MINNIGPKFSGGICNEGGLYFPTFAESAAGEYSQINFLSPFIKGESAGITIPVFASNDFDRGRNRTPSADCKYADELMLQSHTTQITNES